MKIRKAVIPAAGLGTRVLPASKSIPKEMLPIVDKPVIQYIVEEAVKAGITEILIITGRGKGAIEDHFDRSPELEERLLAGGKQAIYDEIHAIPDLANITFIRQKETKGLGHAVLCAKNLWAMSPLPFSTAMMSSSGKTLPPPSSVPPMKSTARAWWASRKCPMR